MVAERYGARLTPAQLEDVRKGIEAVVTGARALRAVKLANSDEPMQPFVPFRAATCPDARERRAGLRPASPARRR